MRLVLNSFLAAGHVRAKKACACSDKHTTLLKSGILVLSQEMCHLLVHPCCNLLVGDGHILCGWSQHTLHQRALPLQVVVHWGGDSKVGKTAEVGVGAVQQVVQTLAALQSHNQPQSAP